MLRVLVRLPLGETLVSPPDMGLMARHLRLVAGQDLGEVPLVGFQLLAVAAQVQVRLGCQLLAVAAQVQVRLGCQLLSARQLDLASL